MNRAAYEPLFDYRSPFALIEKPCYHQKYQGSTFLKIQGRTFAKLVMINPQQKTKIIQKFSTHEKDTGSAEVQIALFSEEIERLTKHLKKHTKDNSSRTGLLKMVAKRRRLLEYLKKQNPKRYAKVVKNLGLKK